MLAIVCPGQGAQAPGMLSGWLADAESAGYLATLSEAANLDLAELGTTADADTIRDTAVAQPLIVATSLLAAHALGNPLPDVTAGHSVGEFAAAALAGVVSDTDAVRLVAARGAAAARAAAAEPTGMSAVVGGDPAEVIAAIEAAGLVPANINSAGQVVAAGALDSLAELAANPPAKARVIPLQVAGAFHTTYMAPAVEHLREASASVALDDPTTTLLSNRDGAVVREGAEVLERLIEQVAHPVRWDLCSDQIAALGVTGVLELAPAGVLTGLAKRGLPGIATFALKSPDDLPGALEFVAEHGGKDES